MGFSFNFFGEQSHRGFNYKPRYYNPEDEERKEFFASKDRARYLKEDILEDAPKGHAGTAPKSQEVATSEGQTAAGANAEAGSGNQTPAGAQKSAEASEYKPGKYIAGSFRNGNYQSERPTSGGKLRKYVGMVGLGLFFSALVLLVINYKELLDALVRQQEAKAQQEAAAESGQMDIEDVVNGRKVDYAFDELAPEDYEQFVQ